MSEEREIDELEVLDYVETLSPDESVEDEADDGTITRYETFNGPFGADAPDCLQGALRVQVETVMDDAGIDAQDVYVIFEEDEVPGPSSGTP